jgi:hypothetical protein
MKHMGTRELIKKAPIVARNLLHGQANLISTLWKFNRIYYPARLSADHRLPVGYEMTLPPEPRVKVDPKSLYVHGARAGRRARMIDAETERFVDATRI